MKELIKKVEAWADEKGIIDGGNWEAQFDKTKEELQELADEIVDRNYNNSLGLDAVAEYCDDSAKMEMGDVLVTLIIQCTMQCWDFEECVRMAYEKISKREGKMADGVFVKDGE